MPELVASLCTLLGAGAAGPDAGPGRVPLSPHGRRRGLCDDLGVPPVAVVRAVAGCALARGRMPGTGSPRVRGRAGTSCSTNMRWPSSRGSAKRASAAAGGLRRAFARWESLIETAIRGYVRLLEPRAEPSPGGGAGSGRAAAWPSRWSVLGTAAAPRVLPRGRRRGLRDLRPGRQRHADRGDREGDRPGRAVRPRDQLGRRPADDHLRARRGGRPVGGLHAQRRADGRRRQGAAQARAASIRPRSTCDKLRDGLRRRPPLPRPGIRLRRRRHDPLGDERREIDADQHPARRARTCTRPARSPRRSSARSPRSRAWSTPGSSSGSIIPSTSSTSTAPRWPTWG